MLVYDSRSAFFKNGVKCVADYKTEGTGKSK